MAVSQLTGMAVTAPPAVTQRSDWLASLRCDACSAQAWIKVQNLLGQELVFCAHHYLENEPKLVGQGFTIKDDGRKFINPAPEFAPETA